MLTEHVDDSIKILAGWDALPRWSPTQLGPAREILDQLKRLTRACCVAAGRDYDQEMAAAVRTAKKGDD